MKSLKKGVCIWRYTSGLGEQISLVRITGNPGVCWNNRRGEKRKTASEGG